jgi:hypothetical protein
MIIYPTYSICVKYKDTYININSIKFDELMKYDKYDISFVVKVFEKDDIFLYTDDCICSSESYTLTKEEIYLLNNDDITIIKKFN